MGRARLRDLGITVGTLPTGPLNAITDIAGVEVGHSTLIRDEPAVVRTGVTMIWPGGRDIWNDYRFAGFHSFNGNGEMTGTIWLAEQGLLTGPIGITCTHCVGAVRDAICSYAVKLGIETPWHLPVVAETHDGWLSNAETFPVTEAMAHAALDTARGGPVAEGNVGGGTGMICHEFKGGIGTSSRVVESAGEHFTVGALVQANYGARDLLRVDGVPVGREIPYGEVPSARAEGTAEQLHHRRARHRRAAPADPMPAPGAPRDHRPRLGRGHRRQFQRRHLHGLLHRQSRQAERASCRCAHAGGRPHDAALPRRRRGHRGSDPERADRRRDDDRLQGPHGPGLAAGSIEGGHGALSPAPVIRSRRPMSLSRAKGDSPG